MEPSTLIRIEVRVLCFYLTFKITDEFTIPWFSDKFILMKNNKLILRVRKLMAENRKIKAIKIVKDELNIGLKEAKFFVERDICKPTEKDIKRAEKKKAIEDFRGL